MAEERATTTLDAHAARVRATAHATARATKPAEIEVVEAELRPVLRVITTPPEVRARYLRWRTVRSAVAMAIAIAVALIAFGFVL